MDILNLIKFFGITILVICCIIATYTDVKYGLIPNKLTVSAIIVGLVLVTCYYLLTGSFNLFYYLSVVLVFIFSYILWILGVWAGGDVKLFTAISTLLTPDFMDIIPGCFLFNLRLPLVSSGFSIPTLWVIVNSIFSVVPLLTCIINYTIINKKPYLIKKLTDTIKISECLKSLNLLIIGYWIFSLLNIDNPIIKIVFMLLFTLLVEKIIGDNRNFTILTSIPVISQQVYTGQLISYIIEFIILEFILIFKNLISTGIVSEVFTDYYDVNELEEGMILSNPLYSSNGKYYFSSYSLRNNLGNLFNKSEGNRIISNNAAGLNNEDIVLLTTLSKGNMIDKIPIKRALPFAPFILSGLFLTLVFGNTGILVIKLMELI